MVGKLFVQYSTNLLNMDLCGIDILHENILIENKEKYFTEKEHVSEKQSFRSSH